MHSVAVLSWALLEVTHLGYGCLVTPPYFPGEDGIISAERTSSQGVDCGISTSGTRCDISTGFMLLILVGVSQRGKLGRGRLSHTEPTSWCPNSA